MLEGDVTENFYVNTPNVQKLLLQLLMDGKIPESSTAKTALISNQASKFDRFTDCANTLLSRDYKGFGNQSMNAVIENVKQEHEIMVRINEKKDGV